MNRAYHTASGQPESSVLPDVGGGQGSLQSSLVVLDSVERQYIERFLHGFRGNRSEAAANSASTA